jgi:hypothetical protein
MFFKLACTTFAFYVGMALIRQVVLFLLVRAQGAVGIPHERSEIRHLIRGYLVCVVSAGVANISLYS